MPGREPLYPHVPKSNSKQLNARYTKVTSMENLIDLLAKIFELSSTQVANRLLAHDIRSWDDFKAEIG